MVVNAKLNRIYTPICFGVVIYQVRNLLIHAPKEKRSD